MRTSIHNGFLIMFTILLAGQTIAQPTWISGSYTGDGAPSKTLSGLGFQPDVVILKADEPQPTIMVTNTMPAGQSKELTSTSGLESDRITGFTADGFTVGDHDAVNKFDTQYYFTAFKADGTYFATGSYTGDGGDGAVNGIGWQANYAFLIPGSPSSLPTYYYFSDDPSSGQNVMETISGGGPCSVFWCCPPPSDDIYPKCDNADENGVDYHYFAIKEAAGTIDVSSYTGQNPPVDDRSISGLGFEPQFVLLNASVYAQRNSAVGGDETQFIEDDPNASDYIQGFEADGFQVGTLANDTVCLSCCGCFSATYRYVAIGEGTTLPIELLNFNAECSDDNNVRVTWSTASETDNDYFTIERSTNGRSFEPVADVQGAGNASKRQNYSYQVANILQEDTVYYRLRQTDLNGKSRTFGPVAVTCNSSVEQLSVQVHPNPVEGSKLNYDLTTSEEGITHVEVLSMNGNVILSNSYYMHKGYSRLVENMADLKAGPYILKVSNRESQSISRFIIE